jgi:hypothetical protein
MLWLVIFYLVYVFSPGHLHVKRNGEIKNSSFLKAFQVTAKNSGVILESKEAFLTLIKSKHILALCQLCTETCTGPMGGQSYGGHRGTSC